MQTSNRFFATAGQIQATSSFQTGFLNARGCSVLGGRPKRIVVPIDFSDCSIEALRRALPLARCFGASITLLNVRPDESEKTDRSDASDSLEAQIRQSYARALESIAQEEVPKDIKTRTVVRQGQPPSEIVAEADAANADLILIAAHGYSGFQTGTLGRTPDQVLHSSRCPVLIVDDPTEDIVEVLEQAVGA